MFESCTLSTYCLRVCVRTHIHVVHRNSSSSVLSLGFRLLFSHLSPKPYDTLTLPSPNSQDNYCDIEAEVIS